jgi:hypothetical protein
MEANIHVDLGRLLMVHAEGCNPLPITVYLVVHKCYEE